MSRVTWLHISDLHLRLPKTPGPNPLPYDANVVLRSFLDDVAKRMEQDGLRPDFIAVTGDVAFAGKAEEYELAQRFFEDLLDVTGLGKEQLYLVPGNHDADWDRISFGARVIADSLTSRDSINRMLAEPKSCDLLFDRFGGYVKFVRTYLGDEALPDERCTYVRRLEIDGRQVALLGLNSAWLAQGGRDDHGKLALGEHLVRGALDQAVGAGLAIALLHHPFKWLQKFERGDSQALLCRECDFILHGHLHETGLTFQREPDAEATVIGAGSLYKGREYPNGYNLVQVDFSAHEGRCTLRAWSDRRGGFWTADTQTYRNVDSGVYAFPFRASAPPAPARAEERWIPVAPVPHFAHRYPLQENFTGRVREREMLTGWWTDGGRRVLAVVALGGMGKSALIWAWLQRDVLGQSLPGQALDPPGVAGRCRVEEAQRPEGVLWWSFYEQGAGFQAFLAEALRYASDGQIDPAAVPSAHERVHWLLTLLQRRRLLLVLDGFERELRAYGSLSAAYQGDKVNQAGRDDFRACIDPHAATFLRSAATLPMRGRVLITSRLFPKELDGMGGCRHWELRRLDPEDAVAFFQAQGMRGKRAEIQGACEPYGYHPLALRLLAGLIAGDLERPGDVAVAAEYPVAGELVPREHHILTLAYDALRPEVQELLSRLAAFRGSVEHDMVEVLFKEPEREPGLGAAVKRLFAARRVPVKPANLRSALEELVGRGLLFRGRGSAGTRRYDLHPVVRGYAYDRLADKKGVHGQLRDYFDAVPKPDEEAVQRVEDLAPTIELYHHTVRAGQYDEAFELFRDRLSDPVYFRFGAYQTCIELLCALFPDGEDQPPRLKDEGDQAWTLNELGRSYARSGQSRRAVRLYDQQIAIRKMQGSKRKVAVGLGNLANRHTDLGELAAAERNLRRMVDLGREIGDELWEAAGHQELGRLLAYRGAFDEAGQEVSASVAYCEKADHQQGYCQNLLTLALRALLLGDAGAALEAARQAREVADKVARTRYPHERDFVRAEWLLGWALTALSRPDEAEPHLSEALSRCRRINNVESEPDILLAWARWHFGKGNREEARQQAAEALAIAERCEYRLKQADVHNFLAEWHFTRSQVEGPAGGDTAQARRHAELAKECAWCDGPPHSYRVALDEAERLLGEMDRA